MLGEPLVWHIDEMAEYQGSESAVVGSRIYWIWYTDTGWRAVTLVKPPPDPLNYISIMRKSLRRSCDSYESAYAAKAACEHHHATGKWN